MAKHLTETRRIVAGLQTLHHLGTAGVGHFVRVQKGLTCLRLQAVSAAIPKKAPAGFAFFIPLQALVEGEVA